MAKILVIEDETLVRENILELLEAEDFEAFSAENGAIGVQLAQSLLPDLIVCDVMMPEIDGYGVLTRLRQNPTTETIPFIFLTAKAAKTDFRQGMEMGADDYLTKPFTRAELLGAITTRLAKQTTLKEHYITAPKTLLSPEASRLEASLRSGLSRSEFQVYYQPQVNLISGKIVGAECLIRWQHPERGLVSPGEFIPVAEATGLIIPIGEWVLNTACEQTKTWIEKFELPLQIAVNLSSRQFNQSDLNQKVVQALQTVGLEPNFLELELTESTVMQDVTSAIATMRELQSLGVKIAIDDFGTGYSSLSYLKQFPFNTLKIDRSFVHDLMNDPKNTAITTALIQMAHNLNLEVVAEGVETEAELSFLCQQNCDGMQGFLFSRPIPASEFEKLLNVGKILAIPAKSNYQNYNN